MGPINQIQNQSKGTIEMKVQPITRIELIGGNCRRQYHLRRAAAVEPQPKDNDKFFETLFAHFTKDEMKEIFDMSSKIRGGTS